MYHSPDLSVWNLTPGGTAVGGAQRVFNVVGRVHHAGRVAALYYSLNGASEVPVFFRRPHGKGGRLIKTGEFNIDTIDLDDLRGENEIVFHVVGRSGRERRHRLFFRYRPIEVDGHRFSLDLNGVETPEQVGQVIDGRWRVGRDEEGVACLEIRKEDAGYDRLIVFGRHDWTTGYEVRARLCVTAWTQRRYHNTGLLYKWNPHRRGNGLHLPKVWSTGLAYYAANSPGLSLRMGVDVHVNRAGKKVGSHIFQQRPLSLRRRLLSKLRNEIIRIGNRPFAQLRPGVHYEFRLHIEPGRYSLTVWPAGQPEPAPQVVASEPPDLLPSGSVGFIVCNAAVRIYEMEVSPIAGAATSHLAERESACAA